MGHIIIHNTSKMSDGEALLFVSEVFQEGNVSATNGVDHPCHVTTWRGAGVYCQNRGKDRNTFYVNDGDNGFMPFKKGSK